MKIDNDKIDNLQLEPTAPVSAAASLRLHLNKNWVRCLLLALVGFAVRSPALQGQLIWDDQYLARDNPFIKSPLLALEAFRHYLFLDSFSAHYRPVQNLSLMVDYAFWNTNTFGFHLTNVLLHVGSGILLYFLLRKLFHSLARQAGGYLDKIDNSLVALFIAALWLVHPVHSAAVDYISGRADSLAFFFACAAWLLFLQAGEVRARAFSGILYFCAAGSALFALCSRESAAVWFALFLLHLLIFEKQFSLRVKAFTIIGCIVVLAGYAGLRQLPEQRSSRGPSAGWSGPVRAVLMLRALGDYGRLVLFPANLHMERSVVNPAAFENEQARRVSVELEYLSIGGLVVGAAFIFFASRRGRGQPVRILGAAWFLLAFLPISNLVDLNATAAEHWLYLPSVGFLIFISGCVVDLPARYRRATVACACVAIVALGARSFVRSSDWLDPETFYRHTAEAGGTSCRVSVNLGQIYAGRGEYEKAERIYRGILKIQPDYTIARNNLADALQRQGKQEEAQKLLAAATQAAHESMKDYPRTWIAAMNLAHILYTKKDQAGAIGVLEKARHDYPDTWELISSESELLREGNKLDDALALIRPYAEKNWWHYGAWMAVGRVLAEKEDAVAAEAALRHASWLDIRSTDALNLIALMRVRQNRFEEAWRLQLRAVARQPDQPRQYVLLSNILDKMGRNDEARAALAEVTRLRGVASSGKIAN